MLTISNRGIKAWQSFILKLASVPAPAGQSALAKNQYIEREGRYEKDGDELEHKENENMPEWARDDPEKYWEAADEHERANGRLYSEVQFALPKELSEAERRGGCLELRRAADGRGAAALYAGDPPGRGERRKSPRAPDVLRARQ